MSEKAYTVQIMMHAEEALREIAFSIAYDLLAPEAAVSWALKTRDAINRLSSFPSKVPLTPEEPWHSFGVHRMVTGKYYVYFLIIEEESKVRVIDVVLQRKDQVKHLIGIPLVEN
ncbi:MAG: hypothetical protein IKO52_06375 [Clostridia bacterium]|nr:hypothetical protein [Clostridia bacterium]